MGRRRPLRRKATPKYRETDSFYRILRHFGLKSQFDALPRGERGGLKRVTCCDAPIVRFGNTIQSNVTPRDKATKARMEKSIKSFKTHGMLSADVITSAVITFDCMSKSALHGDTNKLHTDSPSLSKESQKFGRELLAKLSQIDEDYYAIYQNFCQRLEINMNTVSTCQSYYCVDHCTDNERTFYRKKKFVIERKKNNPIRYEGRTIYPVKCSLGFEELHLELDGKQLFQNDTFKTTKQFPVYIQEHALTRLQERLPKKIPYFIPLTHSIIKPEITKDMIGFYFNEYKLGYLPFEIAEQGIIIKTFKSLTMQGTPESQALYKTTGLAYDDKRYLNIDNLDTLLNSDLCEDSELLKIFEKCGIAHFKDMRDEFKIKCTKMGKADEVRNYLRK